jgi:saccharopine dehydrogenase-like NADP-dependent oxidoreductase
MKITVLGGAGKQAPGVIRDLANSPEVTTIILADMERTREILEQRAKNWGNDKANVALVDINDQNMLRQAIRGSVSLANCTVYHFNLQVMGACLAEGIHYVDMGGLFHTTRKQMAASDQWKKRGAITERGALPAEACVPPEPFFKGLAARGLCATVMIKRGLLG